MRIKATAQLTALGYKADADNCIDFPKCKTVADVQVEIERNGGMVIFTGAKAAPIAEDAASLIKTAYPQFDYSKGTLFKVVIANNRTDRDNERFGTELLSHWADQLKSKPISVCWQHKHEMHGYGKCFGGQVVNGNLEAYLYVSNTAKTPIGENLVESIKMGTVDNLSVGFRAFATSERQPDGNYQWVWNIRPDEPATMTSELSEVSFVAHASQFDAGVKTTSEIQIEEVKEAKLETVLNMYKIEIGGKSLELKVADGRLEGLEAVQESIKSAEAAAKSATDDLAKLREPLEADVINSKTAGLSEGVVKSMKVEDLIEAQKAVVGNKSSEKSTQGEKSTKYENY